MKNRRMFWRIVEEIEASIANGEYPPSTRLPPERELAEKFDVSRPTIREAIIALEVREKIEVKTGSGVYVLASANKVQDKINAFELTQARALIEGEIAALAASTITEGELVELNKTLIAMRDNDYVEEADQMFHQIIATSTRNAALIKTFENLWALRVSSSKVIDDYASVCSKESQKTLDEHTAIYEALVAADAAQARLAMHRHFNRLINVLFDAVEAKALEELKRKSSEKRDLYSIDKLVS